jgi:integrase
VTRPAPLTTARMRAIKPPAEGRNDHYDGDCPGLCLRVTAHDTWTWTLRMRDQSGQLRRFPIGACSNKHGVKWAREQADKLRQQVRHEGRDPLQERRAAAEAARTKAKRDRLTLGVLVEDWRRERLAGTNKSLRYQAEAVRALKHAFTAQWERPADALDKATVRRVLADLRRLVTAPKRCGGMVTDRRSIAGRTAAYGHACFAWAVRDERVPFNPFEMLPMEEMRTPARDRVLMDDELAAIWRAAASAPAPFGALVRTLILTGQRREEVAAMDWSEISADLGTWTIPSERTKNGKRHLVPLSDMARAVLPAPPAEGGLVFPGKRGTAFNGWSKSKAALDTASGVKDWRLHDLRRTLATGLQSLGVRLEVTESVLNHVSGSRAGIVGVYQRHEWATEKRAALDKWAEHVRCLIEGKRPSDNVVPLRRA